MKYPMRERWCGGLAEWVEGDTAYLSIAFTWRLNDAFQRAVWYRQQGYRVRAGGPGVFTRKLFLADVAELGGDYPDAIVRHHPLATVASRGCPVGCWFCIVPKMEGKAFTLLPDFPVRPILCDNNLSALPPDYQDHIVARYRAASVPLLDANSGFEPRTFDDGVYARWRVINRGPWRFAYDDQQERPFVQRVMRMLQSVPSRRKRVYVLIGNEPVASCVERLKEVISWGGEPHAQPYMKLNALERKPHVRFDWTEQGLRDVARWANRYLWEIHEPRGLPRIDQELSCSRGRAHAAVRGGAMTLSQHGARMDDPTKPLARGAREELPRRRPHVVRDFEMEGHRYAAGDGRYDDGRLGEIFLNTGKDGSRIAVMANDAAILASLALQYGCPAEVLRNALRRNPDGSAAGPVAHFLDLLAAEEP